MLKYLIQTYGCQMNVHDSEKLAGLLDSRNYLPCDDAHDADIVVLNTCCIRETAESKVFGHLGILKKIKEDKKGKMVIAVCGCMSQQPDAAQRLKQKCPHVDIIFGTHNTHKFLDYLDTLEQTGTPTVDIWESEGDIIENMPIKRSSGINAWVNIMYGCNNFCSYCIVPYVRGRERSRDFDTIISEVRNLIDNGYKEVTLLGQNVNSYSYKGKTFADLLCALDFTDKKYKLKFMTSHPKDFSVEVADAIANGNNIASYLHLPIQAGSDRILKLMNRHYTSAQYIEKVRLLRERVPDIGLTSDVMVGFPTETEEDFCDTLRVCQEIEYNNLFTFIYSRRKGTPADKMEQVQNDIKHERIKRLIALQADIGKEKAKSYVGKTFEVLCEDFSGKTAFGKAKNDVAVTFTPKTAIVGAFVNVKIKSTKNANLFGEEV